MASDPRPPGLVFQIPAFEPAAPGKVSMEAIMLAMQAAQSLAQAFAVPSVMRVLWPESEVCIVKTNNGDGTFDLLNGTGQLMSRVPCIDPNGRKYILKGYTVQVRYYDVNRQRPYIKYAAPYSKKPLILRVWSQGQADPALNFVCTSLQDLWVPGDATPTILSSRGSDTVTPLGVVAKSDALYWLSEVPTADMSHPYQLRLEGYSDDGGDPSFSALLGAPYAAPNNRSRCWGRLFYQPDSDTLVALDQAGKNAYICSTGGRSIRTVSTDFTLQQCAVAEDRLVKCWITRGIDKPAEIPDPTIAALIKGVALDGSGKSWTWDPKNAIPAGINRDLCVIDSTQDVDGRFPIQDGKIYLWITGWESIPADNNAIVSYSTLNEFNSPEQWKALHGTSTLDALLLEQLGATNGPASKIWASVVCLDANTGVQQWIWSKVWQASREIVTEPAMFTYVTTPGNISPTFAEQWINKSATDGLVLISDAAHGEDFSGSTDVAPTDPAVPGGTVFGSSSSLLGTADELQMDRSASFPYTTTNDDATAIVQHTSYYQYMVGNDHDVSGGFRLPYQQVYLNKPCLCPRGFAWLPQGDPNYSETGEQIFSLQLSVVGPATVNGGDRNGQNVHQIAVDAKGNCYLAFQVPTLTRQGGKGGATTGVAPAEWVYGGCRIAVKDGLYIVQNYFNWELIGQIDPGWNTYLLALDKDGNERILKDIGHYFTPAYRGKKTS